MMCLSHSKWLADTEKHCIIEICFDVTMFKMPAKRSIIKISCDLHDIICRKKQGMIRRTKKHLMRANEQENIYEKLTVELQMGQIGWD